MAFNYTCTQGLLCSKTDWKEKAAPFRGWGGGVKIETNKCVRLSFAN